MEIYVPILISITIDFKNKHNKKEKTTICYIDEGILQHTNPNIRSNRLYVAYEFSLTQRFPVYYYVWNGR